MARARKIGNRLGRSLTPILKPVFRAVTRGRFETLPVAEPDAVRRLGRPGRAALGARFALVSWNVSKLRHRAWLANMTTVAAQADLVLLQEAMLHGDRAHEFHESSGFEWVMAQSFKYPGKAVTTGVKTGARAAALDCLMIRSLDREPLYESPKTLLATRYALHDHRGELLVINIHAMNFVSTRKFSRQLAQLVELMSPHAGPMIVAGDFNTWNARRQRLLTAAMAQFGLARAPVRPWNWRHFTLVLDHVFYRGLVLGQTRPMVEIRGSDHVPLWAEFTVPDA
ncbi:MAG: endonuclease/exonuclease/phosphatase family protein [Rhodospirillaceae bacterium]|nr:endonuclease/exonuclease/phosphatase family protein [Rhodospirillaceae bacterium]